MTDIERSGGRHVTLYVREQLPGPAERRAEAVADDLAALERDGTVERATVCEWPNRIRRDDPDAVASRDLYNAFTQWADRQDLRLTPFFDTRECYSTDTGERSEWIVFPAMCLVVYDDSAVISVYPHADGDEYRTVEDWLEAAGDSDAPRAERPALSTV